MSSNKEAIVEPSPATNSQSTTSSEWSALASRPISPKSLFGSSAQLLKAAELESLKQNGVEENDTAGEGNESTMTAETTSESSKKILTTEKKDKIRLPIMPQPHGHSPVATNTVIEQNLVAEATTEVSTDTAAEAATKTVAEDMAEAATEASIKDETKAQEQISSAKKRQFRGRPSAVANTESAESSVVQAESEADEDSSPIKKRQLRKRQSVVVDKSADNCSSPDVESMAKKQLSPVKKRQSRGRPSAAADTSAMEVSAIDQADVEVEEQETPKKTRQGRKRHSTAADTVIVETAVIEGESEAEAQLLPTKKRQYRKRQSNANETLQEIAVSKDETVEDEHELNEESSPAKKRMYRGRRSAATVTVSENSKITTTEVGTTPSQGSARRVSTRIKSKVLETPVKNVKTPKIKTPHSSRQAVSKTISETPATPSSAVRGRRSTKISKKQTEEENEETEPAVSDNETKSELPRIAETPKKKSGRQVKTPKSLLKSGTKKSNSNGNKKSDTAAEPDALDPFNFDAQVNNHPEPLNNFNVYKSNFGEMKFTRSLDATNVENRYSTTEKAASRNSHFTLSRLALTPVIQPTSIAHLTTTSEVQRVVNAPSPEKAKSSSQRGTQRKSTVSATPKTPVHEAGEGLKTPRRKRHEQPDVELFPPKVKVEVTKPELTPEEQREADIAGAPHPTGARVFARWGNEYYPAFVFERDGLGRYKVIFVENDEVKDVPADAVIPLSAIVKGTKVATIQKDEETEMDQPIEIVRAPDGENFAEWTEGNYDYREIDVKNNKILSINWKKMLITKLQQKDIIVVKNTATNVDKNNVVPKSARRSRLAAKNLLTTDHRTPKSTPSGSKKAKNGDQSLQEISEATKTINKQEKTKPLVSPNLKPKAQRISDDDGMPVAKRAAFSEGAKAKQNEEKEEEDEQEEKEKVEENDVNDVEMTEKPESSVEGVFDGCYFMLTSSARRGNPFLFNKRECKVSIEERGGIVAEDIGEFMPLPDGAKAYLVADTYYRTHKYLFALAASIPCVHINWINECLKNEKLLDHKSYMLPAGISIIDETEHPWRPLKNMLFKNKVLFVHSMNLNQQQDNVVPFAEIWHPLLSTLGAEILTTTDMETAEVIQFCNNNKFDLMLTDRSCDQSVVSHVEDKGVPVVSSNWIIHTMVTGEWAPVSAHASFSPLN